MLTTNKGEILTLEFLVCPLLFKCTKREEMDNTRFSIFHVTVTKLPFTQTFKYLLPGRVALPHFHFWPSPTWWWRYLHHLWGRQYDDFLITTKSKRQLVKTQINTALHFKFQSKSDQFTITTLYKPAK